MTIYAITPAASQVNDVPVSISTAYGGTTIYFHVGKTSYMSDPLDSNLLSVIQSGVLVCTPSPFTTPSYNSNAAAFVIASDGVLLPADSLSQTLAYTSGNLTSITVSYLGNTYVQTLTYTSGNLTGVSNWVKQ